MLTFNQKKLFLKKEFKITESKLYCKETKFGDENEIDILYENLDGDKVSFKSSNGFALFSTILLYVVGIMTHFNSYSYGENRDPYLSLIWFSLGTVMLIVYFISRKNYWKLKLNSGNYIYIHKNIPNVSETNKFLEDLIVARNRYLIENYAQIDENLNYESQLSNLRWLKSINVISKEEFDSMYDELKKTVKPDKNNIGFKK